jgi:hypothetical protein
MPQIASDEIYRLDEQQNAKVLALAKSRREAPQSLVREAVEKYLLDADYEMRRNAALGMVSHNERDNKMFGAWRGANIDGVEYQMALRS